MRRPLASAVFVLGAAGCSLVFASDLDDAHGPGVPGSDAAVRDSSVAEASVVAMGDAGDDVDVAAADGAAADGATTNAYAAVVRADGPSHYWRLEEASGATFQDEIADRALTSTNGILLTYGVPGIGGGKALRFERASAWLQVAGVVAVDADFTIEAWVRPTFTDDFYAALFEQNSLPGGNRDGMFYWINPKRTDVGSAFEVWKTGTNIDGAHGTFVPATSFSHVVVVHQGKVCRTWVNGIQLDKTSDVVIPASTDVLTWGNGLTGDLDELAVYTRALTAMPILAHYNAGK